MEQSKSCNLDELYVTQPVYWRNRLHYITNIFVNGKIVISPKGANKYYTVHYTLINLKNNMEQIRKRFKILYLLCASHSIMGKQLAELAKKIDENHPKAEECLNFYENSVIETLEKTI